MLPFQLAIVLLAVSGSLAAFVSDWFVDALDPAVEALGISKAFTGLVIVAIAGNAVENVVAVQLAWKGQNDLAISVVKNSVAQIACFLWPVLVLASLFFDDQLTFVIEPVFLGALALTAIALWQVTGDGKACCTRASRSSASTSCSRRSSGSSSQSRRTGRRAPQPSHLVPREVAPLASAEADPGRAPRSGCGGGAARGARRPRACAGPGGSGPRGG